MSIEEQVEKWLLDEDLLREMKYDENADFHFIVEFPKENIMDVVKPKDKDSIIIACATQVAPQHITLMENADIKTKKEFILDLNFGLNTFLVDFELQVNNDILRQFVVTEQIFDDGLNKDMLIRTMAPEIIATDEIGGKEDIEAIKDAVLSGVSLIFTMHANSYFDVTNKSYISELIEKNIFSCIVVLSNKNGAGTIEDIKILKGDEKKYACV